MGPRDVASPTCALYPPVRQTWGTGLTGCRLPVLPARLERQMCNTDYNKSLCNYANKSSEEVQAGRIDSDWETGAALEG